ncbi:MAG: glycosyltransferase family 2 protein [Leptolyngbyaceae cyanobacterium]
MTALVSVIIPAYNCAATIAATLNSACGQHHSNLEILVIDDGSQDDTAATVLALADSDPRIQYLAFPNGGPAIARNRGIEKAQGQFIAFLDADDLWTPDKITAQLAALAGHPQAGLAYSWIDWIDEAGQFLRPGSHIQASGNVLEALILRNFIDNGSNVLVRKEVFAQVGTFNPDLPPSEDWDLWLRIAGTYEFICVPQVQVLYRISPSSLSSSNVERLAQVGLTILINIFRQYPELEAKIGRQALADKYRYFTFKSIEGRPSRKNGRLAWRFFTKALILEPRWWTQRGKVLAVVLAKATKFSLGPKA